MVGLKSEHTCKISLKMVKPRDIAGNTEEEDGRGEWCLYAWLVLRKLVEKFACNVQSLHFATHYERTCVQTADQRNMTDYIDPSVIHVKKKNHHSIGYS